MPRECAKCGHTTHETQTDRCVLCKTPFPTEGVQTSRLSSITAANIESETERDIPIAETVEPEVPDNRNWYVKMVHRRSIGGLVLGPMMIVFSVFQLSMTRANKTVAGAELASVGVFVFLVALALFLATKKPGNNRR